MSCYSFWDFGFLTIKFIQNLRALVNHFPSNLLLHLLNKITHKFGEEIKCRGYFKHSFPILSAIKGRRLKLENKIWSYTHIWQETYLVRFLHLQVIFPYKTTKINKILGVSNWRKLFSCKISGKDRNLTYNPFFSKLSLSLALLD